MDDVIPDGIVDERRPIFTWNQKLDNGTAQPLDASDERSSPGSNKDESEQIDREEACTHIGNKEWLVIIQITIDELDGNTPQYP